MRLFSRISRFIFCTCFVAFAVEAGDLPLGAHCKSSSECETKRCWEKVCQTYKGTTSYLPDGTSCRLSGECSSHKCISSVCGGRPKAGGSAASPSGSTRGNGGAGASAPIADKMIMPDTTTACGKDLVDGRYSTDPVLARVNAEDTCFHYKQGIIDEAKKLKDKGFGDFDNILTVITSTPEKSKCAYDEYNKLSPADKKTIGLVLTDACRGPAPAPVGVRGSPAVLACAKDLIAAGVIAKDEEKYMQMEAELDCENSPQTQIDQAKQIVKELSGASMNAVLRALYESTPAQIECAKKEFRALSDADKKSRDFEMTGSCKPKSPHQKN